MWLLEMTTFHLVPNTQTICLWLSIVVLWMLFKFLLCHQHAIEEMTIAMIKLSWKFRLSIFYVLQSEDDNIDDLDDEAMMRADGDLAAVFRARRKSSTTKKDRKGCAVFLST